MVDDVVHMLARVVAGGAVVHRRAVAMTRIKATKEDVWNVLSDYEALPEFVPNLVRSERVQPIPGADVAPGAVRLRQVRATRTCAGGEVA